MIGRGGSEFGTTPKLTALFEYGPFIPGPERNSPKASLYEHEYHYMS